MKIIKPTAELLNPRTQEEGILMLRRIEEYARVSHRSEDKQTEDSWKKFIQFVICQKGDWSVAEHCYATVKFRIDRGCCYDSSTEVLTRNGWKYFEHLTYEDELACLSDSENLEWHKPENIQKFEYNGNLLAFKSTSIDLLVTPNHNMWVYDCHKRSISSKIWKFLEADKLTNGRYLFTKTAKWIGVPKEVIIPAHKTKFIQFPEIKLSSEETEDLFELLGIWITDGHYRIGKKNGSGSCISITQVKQKGRDRIVELCKKLKLRYSIFENDFRIDNGRLVSFVESLFNKGAKTFTAFVPILIKESSFQQIKRFLDGVVLGDGNVHKVNNHIVVYTSSKKFADDLQELFMKINLSANVIIKDVRKENRTIKGRKINITAVSYVVSVHAKKRKKPLLDRRTAKNFGDEENYSGLVWCATVPYHRLYVRRNGKAVWCGNSHEIVRHRIASYTQESTRFVNYGGKDIEFIEPEIVEGKDKTFWEYSVGESEGCYKDMLNSGHSPQIARSVLPNALASTLIMTTNLRSWRQFFMMRTTKETHPDLRRVVIPLLAIFKERIPLLYDDIEPEQKQSISLSKPR